MQTIPNNHEKKIETDASKTSTLQRVYLDNENEQSLYAIPAGRVYRSINNKD